MTEFSLMPFTEITQRSAFFPRLIVRVRVVSPKNVLSDAVQKRTESFIRFTGIFFSIFISFFGMKCAEICFIPNSNAIVIAVAAPVNDSMPMRLPDAGFS